MTVEPGTRLGPYEIVASIGAGGMGEVWRAKDTRLEREVAIKVLPPGFAEDEQLRQRFEREAQAISQLNHPNVCTLFDVGHEEAGETAEPLHYLVMELLEGESLADRVQRGALPLTEVLKVGSQVASALDAAHRQGITHRDLKPANVMLTRSGAKLLDFGLAKTAAEGHSPVDGLTHMPTEETPLTQEGTILGTFQYMAPEQLEGLEADARTDIFALGALLYEMATGRRAFEGESKTSLIAAIVSKQPEPISTVTPMSPPALDHVVRRCLEKDPDDRWQSAQDISSELQWIGEAGSQAGVAAPVSVRRKSREKLAWSLAALATAAAIALLATLLMRDPPSQESIELAIAPPEGGEFLIGAELGSGVISPDGTQVAFAASTTEGRALWVRPLDRDEPRLLPGTERGFYPFWSPDGRWLAFFDKSGSLKKVEIEGGLPETICKARQGRGGSWGEDGWIYLTLRPGGTVQRVPASGGVPEPVTPDIDAERGETAHYWPQALPGGRSLLYFIRSSQKEYEGIYLGKLDEQGRESERRRIVASSSSGLFVPQERGSLSGHLLWVREGQLVARTIDMEQGELTGDAIEVGVSVRVLVSHRGALASVSNNGILVSSTTEPVLHQVVWSDRSGAGPNTLPAPEGALYWPRVSSDGRSLAVMVGEGGDSDLWIMDLAAGTSHPVTSGASYDEAGAWSPDSTSLFYMAGTNHGNVVTRINFDRGGSKTPDLDIGDDTFYPWSWTGNNLIFGSYSRDGESRIGALDLADPSEIRVVSENEELSALGTVDATPDGRMVAWISGGQQQGGAFVSSIVSGDQSTSLGPDHQRIAVDSPTWVGWSRQADELFILGSGRTLYSVPVSASAGELQIGTPELLFRLPSPPLLEHLSVSPDGQRLYYVIEPNAKSRTLRVLLNWQARLEGQ